ncbi:MAG: trypsin-like peptidase domain-containing protein [Proteobacteria bacterium]|nr:trypsin-like peptidase domain-containing protein [Pseudomonadota bacterium]
MKKALGICFAVLMWWGISGAAAAAPKAGEATESLKRAEQLITIEHLGEALSLLKSIDASTPKIAAKVDVLLGNIYLRIGKPAKALDMFEGVALSTMDDADAYLGMARATLALGRLSRARTHARTTLKTNPDLIDAHLVLAKADDRTGLVEKARQRFGTLLRDQPDSEIVAAAYAAFLTDRGEPKAATKMLKGFLGRHPSAAEVGDLLGQILWNHGSKPEGLRHRAAAARAFKFKGNAYRSDAIKTWIEDVDPRGEYSRKPVATPQPQAPPQTTPKATPRTTPRAIILDRPQPFKLPRGHALSQGSGFIIGAGTHVVTNRHVIKGAIDVFVRSGTGEVRKAKVIAVGEKDDLAILELTTPYPEGYGISYQNMSDPRTGRTAVVMGFPMASVLGTTVPSLTEGIVSKTSGLGDNPRTFFITSKMNQGNSGGPVFDRVGNVIGVAVAKLATTKFYEKTGILPEDVNIAIKISRVFDLLNKAAPPDRPSGGREMSLEDLYQVRLPSVVLIVSVLAKK